MINLFLAVVIEGFMETLKQNQALISPAMADEIIQKWSEYDSEGSGFITPDDLVFFLYEINFPLGLKN